MNPTEHHMYSSQRQDLVGIYANLSKPSRGDSQYAAGYESVVVDKKAGIWDTLSTAAIREYKGEFKEQFPSASSIIDSYRGVDQEDEGACSLVGFINCAQLSGKSITKARRQWKGLWNRHGNDSMADIAEMLDTFSSKLGFTGFEYIPINGNPDEKYFNKTFWNPTETKAYWQITSTQYSKCPFVWENGYLIETLLKNNVVEINALEHSRTCIAFNDEHLLFADNWDPSVELISKQKVDQRGKHNAEGNPVELFAAGFSRVNKWLIYSMMRDIVYFRTGNSKSTTSKKSTKSKTRTRVKQHVAKTIEGGTLSERIKSRSRRKKR